MARNGSGTYSLPSTMAVSGQVASSTTVNTIMDDIATALTDSVNKDGTKAWAANQPMGSKKFTGIADGSSRTDSVSLGQVQDGVLNWVDGGGTADAITATYSPAITALVNGQICNVRATAANATTTPTFAPNGLTARTIKKLGAQALLAGDIFGNDHELHLRYNSSGPHWELLNPGGVGATTTQVLEGVSTTTNVTPDALAALWEQGSNVASAATMALGEGGYFFITGTTTITDIDFTTDKAGRRAWLKFNDVVTVTHHATTLICPGAANIVTKAGDMMEIISEGSDAVRVLQFVRGGSVTTVTRLLESQSASSVAQIDFALDSYPEYTYFKIIGSNIVPASDAVNMTMRVSTDGGTVFDSGASAYRFAGTGTAAGAITNIDITGTLIRLNSTGAQLGTGTAELFNFEMLIPRPAVASYLTIQWTAFGYDATPHPFTLNCSGQRAASQVTTDVRFAMSTGNIASGEFRLIGVA